MKISVDIEALVFEAATLFTSSKSEARDAGDRMLAISELSRGDEQFGECFGRIQWLVQEIPAWIGALDAEGGHDTGAKREAVQYAIAKLGLVYYSYTTSRGVFEAALCKWAQARAAEAVPALAAY